MRILLTAITLAIALVGNADAARKKTKYVIPEFSAKSYLIADSAGSVLKEHDMDAIMPIASISKLMVGLLTSEQNLDETLSIPDERLVHSTIPRRITSLTRRELLTLALVKSDNLASQILCTNLPNCIEKMNLKAAEIGMSKTKFVEPTGLSPENISTANDLLKLLLVAIQDHAVSQISSMNYVEIPTDKLPIKVRNTNPLTGKMDISLSKTGYTKPAGGCLVMILNSTVGQRILILLGSRDSRTRIPDMERLVKGLD